MITKIWLENNRIQPYIHRDCYPGIDVAEREISILSKDDEILLSYSFDSVIKVEFIADDENE